MADAENLKSTLPQGDGIPEAQLPEADNTSSNQHFSDVVSQATATASGEKRVSFSDRLKKVRQTRNTRRNSSDSLTQIQQPPPVDFKTATSFLSSSSLLAPPSSLLLPTVKEGTPLDPSTTPIGRTAERTGGHSFLKEESTHSKEEMSHLSESVNIFTTSQDERKESSTPLLLPSLPSNTSTTLKDNTYVDTVSNTNANGNTNTYNTSTHTNDINTNTNLHTSSINTNTTSTRANDINTNTNIHTNNIDTSTIHTTNTNTNTDDDLPYKAYTPKQPTPSPPQTPPLPNTPPPMLPASPPPSDFPPITDYDSSLSPTLLPGEVQFSTTSDEVFVDSRQSINTGISSDVTTPSLVYDERRRSNTSAIEFHFKPSLKKWDVINLNEVSNNYDGHETPPHDSYLKSFGDIRTRSYSGVSQISSGNVEQSLESIAELSDAAFLEESSSPSLPVLVQERLMSGNIGDKEISMTQVAKTSWQSKLPSAISDDNDFKTASACELTNNNKEEILLPSLQTQQDKFNKAPLPLRPFKNKRVHSMYEEGQNKLLEMSGSVSDEEEKGGERGGNLNRLNQDNIPKSMSSLFDAVVSDIPGFNEEDKNPYDDQDNNNELITTDEPPLSLTPMSPVDSTLTDMSPLERSMSPTETSQPISPTEMSPPISPTERSLPISPTERSPPILPNERSPPISPNERSLPSSPVERSPLSDSSVQATSGGKGIASGSSRGRELMMKVYMHTVHPSIVYKMFRVTDTTSCTDLVAMALKRANLIEDLHSYSLYHIHNTTKAILEVLQEDDHPMQYLSAKTPSHWELRRRMDNTKIVNVNIELSDVSAKCLSLTLSTFTTSQEVIELISRKLDLPKVNKEDSPLRLLTENGSEERLMGCDSPLLYNRPTNSKFKLVNIVQHLTKNHPSEIGTIPKPNDFETAKVLLQQSLEKIAHLEKELVVKEYTIEQSTRDLQEARTINDKLLERQNMLEKEVTTSKGKLDVAMKSIEELHEVISQLKSEKRESLEQISFLKSDNDKLKEDIEKNEGALSKLSMTLTQLTTSSHHSVAQLKQEVELLNKEKTELLEVLKERNSNDISKEMKEKSNKLSRLSIALVLSKEHQDDLGIMLDHQLENTTTNDDDTTNTITASCIVKSIGESSVAFGLLFPGDRIYEVNGQDVCTCKNSEEVIRKMTLKSSTIEANDDISSSTTVHLVIGRYADNVGSSDYWKNECDKLSEENKLITSSLNEHRLQIKAMEEENERISKENSDLKERKIIHDIDELRKQLIDKQNSKTDESQSLADILQDASREELLDNLRTVESECLQHKESLDRLFGLIVGHTPDLLSVIAEVHEESEGEEGESHDNVGEIVTAPNTGSWI